MSIATVSEMWSFEIRTNVLPMSMRSEVPSRDWPDWLVMRALSPRVDEMTDPAGRVDEEGEHHRTEGERDRGADRDEPESGPGEQHHHERDGERRLDPDDREPGHPGQERQGTSRTDARQERFGLDGTERGEHADGDEEGRLPGAQVEAAGVAQQDERGEPEQRGDTPARAEEAEDRDAVPEHQRDVPAERHRTGRREREQQEGRVQQQEQRGVERELLTDGVVAVVAVDRIRVDAVPQRDDGVVDGIAEVRQQPDVEAAGRELVPRRDTEPADDADEGEDRGHGPDRLRSPRHHPSEPVVHRGEGTGRARIRGSKGRARAAAARASATRAGRPRTCSAHRPRAPARRGSPAGVCRSGTGSRRGR